MTFFDGKALKALAEVRVEELEAQLKACPYQWPTVWGVCAGLPSQARDHKVHELERQTTEATMLITFLVLLHSRPLSALVVRRP